MPQIDVFTFNTQINYIFICFLLTYFLVTKNFLPRTTTIMKIRVKKLGAALSKALNYNTETKESEFIFNTFRNQFYKLKGNFFQIMETFFEFWFISNFLSWATKFVGCYSGKLSESSDFLLSVSDTGVSDSGVEK